MPSRAPQRRIEATQSAAVTGAPSCHASPSRSRNVQVIPSSDTSQVSTICGCTLNPASTANSVS